ncbi:PREDICTED: inactive protein RESTRICTED TEV MOVEMENT 2-like [Nelumbo nucifera]|uniref:Inactive protein RESTRICTED TEV MOVEMENT 2-like n=2 Tax=Nelumbo nucifera TaxID=4432 RepID=A0A1U7YYY8_NELNU|nr:PREDICTED: inactive protein RESTRICTED TEV MOVEMENT 2-like [Nelumbo nucifera]DAD30048.1 TPA_asm: hypothetical protein HUJ06_031516 [Nelumbo nucifera]
MDRTGTRMYEDFQPSLDWKKEAGSEVAVVRLPGFKKEQLRVQLASGALKISGERPINNNRWSRFQKEFKLPQNCETKDIRAQFVAEVLTIVMPKAVAPAQPQLLHPTGHKPEAGSPPAPKKSPEEAVTQKPESPEKRPETPSQKSAVEAKPSIADDEGKKENGRPSDDAKNVAEKTSEKKGQGGGFVDGEKVSGDKGKNEEKAGAAINGEARAMDGSSETAAAGDGSQAIGQDKPRKLIMSSVAVAVVVMAFVAYLLFNIYTWVIREN